VVAQSGESRERRVLAVTAAIAARSAAEATALTASWAELAREDGARWRSRALRQLIAAARYRAPATPLAKPVLLLAGARDRLVDARCAAVLGARLGATTVRVHPEAGHDLPLDDARWVCDEIAKWLIETKLSQSC
jgi:pimeloyl-ACP methyl ester carboxylesterase